jgi:hypothetical protein
LGAKNNIRSLVNPIILKDRGGEKHDALQYIFETRNSLVHEISYSTIGPWLVRDAIDIAEAREMGTIVLGVIEAIEAKLTEIAPDGFPNKLDSTLGPQDEVAYLVGAIADTEKEFEKALRKYRGDTGKQENVDDWLSVQERMRAARCAESEFISSADFMFNRHADFKTPLKIAILKRQLEALKLLLDELV